MKLVQHLKIMGDYSISTWLSEAPFMNAGFEHLVAGPLELSYHPFSLCVWASIKEADEQVLSEDLLLHWRIVFADDEQRKPLLNLRSPHRALLLLSELFSGLHECTAKVDFRLEGIKPEAEACIISLLASSGTKEAKLIGASVASKMALDSLLFCRGLYIQQSSLIGEIPHRHQSLLKAIFNS